jgi:hypothetical protein
MESFRRSFFAVLKYYSAILGGNFSNSAGQLKKKLIIDMEFVGEKFL